MSVDDSRRSPQLTDYEKGLLEALREERRRKLGMDPPAAPAERVEQRVAAPESAAAKPASSNEAPSAARMPPEKQQPDTDIVAAMRGAPTKPPPVAPKPPGKREPQTGIGVTKPASLAASPPVPPQVSGKQEAAPPVAIAKSALPRDAVPLPPPPPEKRAPAADSPAPKPALTSEPVTQPPRAPLAGAGPIPVAASTREQRLPDPHALPQPDRRRPRHWLWITAGSLLAVMLAAGALVLLKTVHNPPQPAATVPPPSPPPPPVEVKKTPAPAEVAAAEVERTFALYRTDRKDTRAELQAALANPALDRGVREAYLEVSGNRVRLRSTPAEAGPLIQTLRRGSLVRLNERSAKGNWCEVRLPTGETGWLKCNFLKPVGEAPPGSGARP